MDWLGAWTVYPNPFHSSSAIHETGNAPVIPPDHISTIKPPHAKDILKGPQYHASEKGDKLTFGGELMQERITIKNRRSEFGRMPKATEYDENGRNDYGGKKCTFMLHNQVLQPIFLVLREVRVGSSSICKVLPRSPKLGFP
jgi:hypothetical protein